MAILDSLCAPSVEQGPLDTPPSSPTTGASYIVGPSATGAWAGHGGKLAVCPSGGWRFIDPPLGMRVFVKSTGLVAEYRSGGWEMGIMHAETVKIDGQQVVSSQEASIANPSGGSTVDTAARAAIGQILAALRNHGLIAS